MESIVYEVREAVQELGLEPGDIILARLVHRDRPLTLQRNLSLRLLAQIQTDGRIERVPPETAAPAAKGPSSPGKIRELRLVK